MEDMSDDVLIATTNLARKQDREIVRDFSCIYLIQILLIRENIHFKNFC
jgi:hypothetical protein